jgi:hypothetical protein
MNLGARQTVNRGPCACDKVGRPNKLRRAMFRPPSKKFRLSFNSGEGFCFGRRSVEHRDDPTAFIVQSVAITQDYRQEPVRRATNLLRGTIADL